MNIKHDGQYHHDVSEYCEQGECDQEYSKQNVRVKLVGQLAHRGIKAVARIALQEARRQA